MFVFASDELLRSISLARPRQGGRVGQVYWSSAQIRGLLPKAQFDVITKLFDFLHRCVAPAPTGRDITEVLCPAAGCTHFCKFVFSSLCCVGQLMFLRAELIPVLTEHFPFAQQSTTLHAALHLPGWPITFCCCHLTAHARWRLCVWRAEQMLRWGPSSTVACWAPER